MDGVKILFLAGVEIAENRQEPSRGYVCAHRKVRKAGKAPTDGNDVRVNLSLASKFDDPQMHRALAEGGREILFENTLLEDVTAGLDREDAFIF